MLICGVNLELITLVGSVTASAVLFGLTIIWYSSRKKKIENIRFNR